MHITNIVDGNKTVSHLCESCAQKASASAIDSFPADFFPNIQKIVDEVKSKIDAGANSPKDACPNCGMSMQELEKKPMAHCPLCYITFADKFADYIYQMQGVSTTHKGKGVKKTKPTLKTGYSLSELQQELETAIGQERYEDAAIIRDKLKLLANSK